MLYAREHISAEFFEVHVNVYSCVFALLYTLRAH